MMLRRAPNHLRWVRSGLVTLLLASGACADDAPTVTTTFDTAGTTDDTPTTVGTFDPDSTGPSVTSSQTGDTSDTDAPDDTTADGTTRGETTDGETTDGETTDGETTGGPVCGDGMVEAGEECDGTNLDRQSCESQGFDGGRLACQRDCTFDVTGCTSRTCGNDTIEGVEDCDGTALGGETCLTQGFDGGALACANDCSFDTSGCTSFMCGNGSIEGMEACDGADLGGQTCQSQGFDAGALACANNCTFDTGGCTNFTCGNGIIEGGEACDGAALGGQTCQTQGFDGGALACANDCSFDTSGCTNITCGNGAIEPGETCDGAALGGQTCVSQGFPGGGALACAANCLGYDTSGCNAGGTCSHPLCEAGAALVDGCDPCVTQVCAADPFCCNNSWDAICVGEVTSICGIPCGGGAVCGNGATEAGEVCDGADLAGQSCVSQGFPGGGVLGCSGDCLSFDTAGCNAGGACSHPLCEAGAALVNGCDPCVTQVCAVDPFCCNNSWDGICVGEVTSVCGIPCGGGAVCGNGAAEAGEVCDGADLAGQTCVSQGFPGGGVLACAGTCQSFDTAGCNAGGACSHPLCEAGAALVNGCDPCVTQVCAADPFCCSNSWDGICVGEVTSICGIPCGGGAVCGNGAAEAGEVCDGADLAGQSCVSQGFPGGGVLGCSGDCLSFNTGGCNAGGACSHPLCEAGAALVNGCDPCVTQVCAADPFCCNNSWDGICVGEVTSICGIPCGGGAVCGNGAAEAGEVCDGADLAGQSCVSQGFPGGGALGCSGDCLSFDTGGCNAGGACAHPLCDEGTALVDGCDPCVTQICAVDSFCCTNSWDGICVDEVTSVCGLPCGGGGGCAHPICQAGAALADGCDPCVTQICAVDAFCCSNSWDDICVGEVGSVCGQACP